MTNLDIVDKAHQRLLEQGAWVALRVAGSTVQGRVIVSDVMGVFLLIREPLSANGREYRVRWGYIPWSAVSIVTTWDTTNIEPDDDRWEMK